MERKRVNSKGEGQEASTGWHLPPRLLPLIFGSLLCILSTATCLAQQNPKNVLFIFSSFDQQRRDLNTFETALRARTREPLTFYATHVDYEQMGDSSYRESLAETFHNAYKSVKFAVVVASSYEALEFIINYRARFIPAVPVVFYALSPGELDLLKLPAGITGITSDIDLRETIDLALRLHPDAQSVALVTGTPGFWWKIARAQLDRYRSRVKAVDVFGLPSKELLDRVAALPPHTIVLFQLPTPSATQSDFTASDVLAAAAVHAPTYCAWKDSFILGCIGGAYVDWDKYIDSTAQTTARLLSGQRPENIPVKEDSDFVTEVDWRELHRWNISESLLPPGAVVLDREPTFWALYRRYIIIAVAVILAQTLLIVGLLWQRARKRKAEAYLRESEERFRVMADTSPSLIWMGDAKGEIVYLSERWAAFTGHEPRTGYSNGWIGYVHPDDIDNTLEIYGRALRDHQSFSNEHRVRSLDGTYRWMFNVASPRKDGNGSFAGFIGSAIDVTDHKLAQQALSNVSGQLIQAQEQERSRIARELHDDICQRLAILSMGIDQANTASEESPTKMKENLTEIGELCHEIATDVQHLSHQLHSSVLDYLGLTSAIASLCSELTRQYDIDIEFTHNNILREPSKDVSLCLFRIAQEALHNAVKYSGVNRIYVNLRQDPDKIRLLVMDRGAGFDVEEAKKNGSLGLVSMQERAHSVRGTISIFSKPGEGTKIVTIIPMAYPQTPWVDVENDEIPILSAEIH